MSKCIICTTTNRVRSEHSHEHTHTGCWFLRHIPTTQRYMAGGVWSCNHLLAVKQGDSECLAFQGSLMGGKFYIIK